MKSLEERFWPKVDIRGPDECWEWLAGKMGEGYGVITQGRYDEGKRRAHRVAWELTFGPIPDGLHVCHHCDNPGCINPAHLFLGNDAENMADSVRKGRSARGERNRHAKLTEEQVISIREEHARGNVTHMELAGKYGVTFGNIGYIVRRETWRHI